MEMTTTTTTMMGDKDNDEGQWEMTMEKTIEIQRESTMETM